jgi:hypothetical protein
MARSTRRLLTLVAALVVSALGAGGAMADSTPSLIGSLVPSLIGGNCGTATPAFASFGDPRYYYLIPDGGFEAGGAGWTFTGAKVVSGNDPFYLHSQSDASSLLISSGGSAISPPSCFGLLNPGLRFVAVAPSGSATLHVRLIAHGLLGVLTILDGGTVRVGPTWAPTPILSTLGSQLSMPLGTKTIQVELTATGNVQVDDLFVDPFLMR